MSLSSTTRERSEAFSLCVDRGECGKRMRLSQSAFSCPLLLLAEEVSSVVHTLSIVKASFWR
jgi:hypothetical protein